MRGTERAIVAAEDYLRHKGYPDAEPYDVAAVEGDWAWYLSYVLPDGDLELEVTWVEGEGWRFAVTSMEERDRTRSVLRR